MSKNLLFFALFFGLSLNAFAKTEKNNPYVNERFVVNALKQIQIAEMTFRENTGQGSFGAFYQLRAVNLIDAALASTQKYGYSFSIVTTAASSTTSSTYYVVAVPQRYRKTGRKSFYIDESCRIRGADKNGASANIDDPVIEACSPSVLVDNEAYTMDALRTLFGAELAYQSTIGSSASFGTISQLLEAGLISESLGFNFYRGYYRIVTVTAPTAGNPSTFKIQTRPEAYQRTGKTSFYIDQTGVLRGADRNGQYADQNDPPIQPQGFQGFSRTYNLSAQSDFELLRISY
jgi:hypothetical protein